MKEYIINCEIRLFCDHIEFKDSFEVSSDFEEIKKIELKSQPEKIVVNYSIITESEREAQVLVGYHLKYLANRLAFIENIRIKELNITNISCIEKEGQDIAIRVIDSVNLQDRVVVKRIIDKESIDKIRHFLQKDISDELTEYLMMYSEAISEESAVLKFILFYRILEKIIGKKKAIDDWIKIKEPGVMIKNDHRDHEKTIYSYLRDNIHPKQSRFPYKEIADNMHKFRELAKVAIKEKID